MVTRSGRTVKKPVIFTPTETVLDDDYCTDDYNTEIDSDIGTDEECLSDESEYEDDDDDADENGNLQDFVVDDEEESESEDA